MPAQPTADGILIQSYTPNLSDADMRELLDIAAGRAGQHAQRYGEWIATLIGVELERRQDDATDTPTEADLPRFNGTRWTGAELADALQASFAACGATADSPRVNDLLTKLDEVIRGWSAHRLRKIG